jgi:hypothetical protein
MQGILNHAIASYEQDQLLVRFEDVEKMPASNNIIHYSGSVALAQPLALISKIF